MDMLFSTSVFLASVKVTEKRIRAAVDSLGISPSKNLEFIDNRSIRVAAVQYEWKEYQSLKELVQDINSYVEQAVKKSAQLIVFPEMMGYMTLSIIPMYDKIALRFQEESNPWKALKQVTDVFSEYMFELFYNLFADLAEQHRVYIMAGTTPVNVQNRLYNRGYLFNPKGESAGSQDKLFLSEHELGMGLSPARKIDVVKTPIGILGMINGQDERYYEPFKILSLSGADIITVSSMEKGEYNCYQDLGGAAARAYECNVFCVKSTAVGRFITGERLTGCAGIYAPWSALREPHGVLAQASTPDKREVVCARLDLARLDDAKDFYNSTENNVVNVRYAANIAGSGGS